jgi:hypothetical protein
MTDKAKIFQTICPEEGKNSIVAVDTYTDGSQKNPIIFCGSDKDNAGKTINPDLNVTDQTRFASLFTFVCKLQGQGKDAKYEPLTAEYSSPAKVGENSVTLAAKLMSPTTGENLVHGLHILNVGRAYLPANSLIPCLNADKSSASGQITLHGAYNYNPGRPYFFKLSIRLFVDTGCLQQILFDSKLDKTFDNNYCSQLVAINGDEGVRFRGIKITIESLTN